MYKSGKFYVKLAVPDGTTFPTHTSIETGSLFYRDDEGLLYIYSGEWRPIPVYTGTPSVGDAIRWNGDIWIASGVGGGAGVGTFLNLTDTPNNYTGAGGYTVTVKDDETGLEFSAGGAVSGAFLDLNDTPSSYTGYGGYLVSVKDDELSLEFIVAQAGGDGGGGGNPFFFIDGTLAGGTDMGAYVVTADSTISNIYLWGDILGSGTTIIDVHKRTSSDVPGTTIFTTQANRPSLISSDPDHVIKSAAPNVTSVAEGDVLSIDIDQVATGASNLSIVIAMEPSGDSGSDAWGGNLIKNSPGQIAVDEAEPQWWDDVANATITDEDAAGETIPEKSERVFKVVTTADDVYGYQTFTFADEDLLDAGQTILSLGCWVYCASASKASIGIYGTNLGLQESNQHTGDSTWQWLTIEDVTLDGSDTSIEVRLIVDTGTTFFAMPMLTVGPVARPWVARGLHFVSVNRVTHYDLNTTGDVAWSDTDCTANSDNLAVLISVSCRIFEADGTIGSTHIINHSDDITGSDTGVVIARHAINSIWGDAEYTSVMCNDGQVIRYSVAEVDADADVRAALMICGYWRWA